MNNQLMQENTHSINIVCFVALYIYTQFLKCYFNRLLHQHTYSCDYYIHPEMIKGMTHPTWQSVAFLGTLIPRADARKNLNA